MIITGKLYDRLKFLAMIGLPALATLYFTLAQIWGLGGAEQVVGSIVALDTFLGVVLQISSANFQGSAGATLVGILHVKETATGGKLMSLEVAGDPEQEIEGKDKVVFKVKVEKRPGGSRRKHSV